jgi:endonuclease-3
MTKIGDEWRILKHTYKNAKYYLNFKTPVDLVAATILSAQTRDENVNAATPKLFADFKTAKDYASVSPFVLAKYISNITFSNVKAKNIVNAMKIINEKYAGKVPKTIEELIELPGIGRKTANAILQNAYGVVVGVPCDTHVLRVAYRLSWTKNTNPEKVEADLMKLFPKSDWEKIPHVLKAHGRAVCTAPVPKCGECPVNKLCPKAGVKKHT